MYTVQCTQSSGNKDSIKIGKWFLNEKKSPNGIKILLGSFSTVMAIFRDTDFPRDQPSLSVLGD